MDEFEKMIADADQAGEEIKLLAPVIHGYFWALFKEGFTREEAFELAKEYQISVFHNIKNN